MSKTPSSDERLRLARTVLETEAASIQRLVDQLDENFLTALDMLTKCQGRVIVTGMGKSGIISRKIAATLSSTGTASYFLHPAEAVHGDLGVIQSDDLLIALSQSGETPEILRLLETLKRLGAMLIAITGSPSSSLGLAADVTLNTRVSTDACPLNLVPTASTTAALAMGDALAMTLLVAKGFQEEDFANLHPGGNLGKRLLRVERLMKSGDDIPPVTEDSDANAVIQTISSKGLGMTCVTNPSGKLTGVITDGDLRRHLLNKNELSTFPARDLMTPSPHTISQTALAVQALHLMEERRVTSLAVVDDNQRLIGVLHLHHLWRTELF